MCSVGLLLLFLTCVASSNFNNSFSEVSARNRRQSETKGCILPSYPDNGYYSVRGAPNAKPGDQLEAAQVQVSCQPGYRPLGNSIVYCVFGTWSNDLAKCARFCKLTPHPSVKYRCQVTDDDTEESYYRDCEEFEPTGTIVRPTCNEPNYYFTGVLSHMRCIEGRWNYIAICQPECGIVTAIGKPLAIGGRETRWGEFPWHAAIYRKDFTPYKNICGGTLVSDTVIITAAHCFWDQYNSKLRPASMYAVALGKLYRGWNNAIDEDAQKFDVVSIKVPARYQDAHSNYQDDIAAATLSAPVELRPQVRPVCLDFDPFFDAHQLRDGNLGKVAGWGIKNLDGTPSPVLRVLELPYVRIERCIEEAPSTFRPFITSDKICAGYKNGSALCEGDSGGGLVFAARVRIAERYYLRGIVSTAPESQLACNIFDRTTFTKITKHKNFIEKTTISFDQTPELEPEPLCILPPYPENGKYLVQGSPSTNPGQSLSAAELVFSCNPGYILEKNSTLSCVSGRWTEAFPKCIEIECGRVFDEGTSLRRKRLVNGRTARRGEVPWQAGVFDKNKRLICAGAIVSRSTIITVAHCVWNGAKRQANPASDYGVSVGNLHRAWEDKDDLLYAQYFDVKSIKLPQRFLGTATLYQDDIAILILSDSIKYNRNVAPVCLDFDNSFDQRQLQSGKLGKIAGWGITDPEVGGGSSLPNFLQVVELPYVEIDECIKLSPPDFRPFITSDKICFGYTNGTAAICRGDTGGALAFPEMNKGKERYYLRAVPSVGPVGGDGKACDSFALTGFTHIIKHEKFIKENLQSTISFDQTPEPPCILPPYPENGNYLVQGSPSANPGQSLSAAELVFSCNSGYILEKNSTLSCVNGHWTEEFPKCIEIECGRVFDEGTSLRRKRLVNGRTARRGEVPWQAGVFAKNKRLICAGAIVSPSTIITVAHCVWNEAKGQANPASDYGVSVGNLHRAWEDKDDLLYAQYFDVKSIKLPQRFFGTATSYQDDIAILILSDLIKYNRNVVPVCLDFDNSFDQRQLQSGKLGKIAGWGITDPEGGAGSNLPNFLQVVELPYVEIDECFRLSPPEFRPFITSDKICFGYTNGTAAICRGDTGGALAFPEMDKGKERYYLRAVPSVGPVSRDDKACNSFALTGFTHIIKHEQFIKENLQ